LRSVRLARDGATTFAAVVGANVLTYVFYASATRALGVSDAGAVLAVVAATLFGTLPSSVLGAAITKEIADRHARGDLAGSAGIAYRAERYALVGAVFCVIVVVLARRPLAEAFAISPASVDAGALALGGWLVLPLPRAILQGSAAFKAFAFSFLIDGVTKAVLGVFILARGANITAALQGYAATVVISAAATMYLVRVVLGRGTDTSLVPSSFATIARRAIPMAALTGMIFAGGVVARLVLTPRDAGWFNAVALAGRALVTMVAFLSIIALPAAAQRSASKAALQRLVAACTGASAAIIAIVLGIFFIAPSLVVRILAGPAFVGAGPLLFPFGVAMGALAIAIVLASILVGLGDETSSLPLLAVFAVEMAFAVHAATAEALVRVMLAGHGAALITCAVLTARKIAVTRSERSGFPAG